MTQQITASINGCLYCNTVLNPAGYKGQGMKKGYIKQHCHREHSHKHYVFKQRVESLLQSFNLIGENEFKEDGELTQDSYKMVMAASEWMNLGIRVDILNPHLQSVIKNKSSTYLPTILKRIEEQKKRLEH